ncbi:ParA family protein [Enterobacter hormaechei]|uniref:ParA family protein n=1 Tax=Enterobacter hormaechei TaxID=158836 RepID=UPI0012530262|nr:ParA family protein [Enterobacter hormaechei]ECC3269542.1 ParA family protein [Salmonella enterica subsp. enterica]EDK1561881.1 ParA family protein [Salmonella enterica subsp. enterica serovar Newport]EHD0299442.1 ParA family protein [Salmonella enterica subsp. enterica serovar Enteritidis]EIY8279339.1 ParA family protein [Salmonella enterica]VAK79302.1 Chromosome (plasmid) partitioning protein ParA, Sporulation initiation inhibitor protein Soj [Enterobacter cloacae]
MTKKKKDSSNALVKSFISEAVLKAIRAKCPVIANGNAKGGVGKTTAAAHEVWYAAELGLKVLAIDFDKHLTEVFTGSTTPDLPEFAAASDLFTDEGITKPIYKLEENIYFLPADHYMKDVDGIGFDQGIYTFPAKHMDALRKEFDLIIIDSPPSEGNRQQASLLASTTTVVTSELNKISINGVKDVLTITNQLVNYLNGQAGSDIYKMPACIVLPNKYDSRRKRDKEFYDELCSFEGLNITPLLPSRSPTGASLSDSQPVWKYRDGNGRTAAKEMKAVLNHIFNEVA